MKRLLILIALVGAVAAPAAATEFAAYRFNYPGGWALDPPASDGLVTARSPDGATNCNSYQVPLPALAAASQAEVNTVLTRPWTAREWADFVGLPADKMVLVETRVTAVGPHQLRTGTLRVKPGAMPTQSVEIIAYLGVTLKPGLAATGGCYAMVQSYAANRAVMEAAVNSLRMK
jgi:hypothetical protein